MKYIFLSAFTDFWKEQFNDAFGGGMSGSVEESLNPEHVNIFGLWVDPALVTAFIVSFIMIVLVILIRIFVIPRFKKHPKGLQLLLETIVSYFDDSATEATHSYSNIVGPFILTTAIYIALATLIELISLRPAFASINACFAMGILSFIIINYCGYHKKKHRRLLRVINPFALVPDLAIPISLSLRLFGSILSGYIIMELVYSMPYTALIIPAFVAIITTLMHAILQAYIFTTLTNTFINEAIE